MDEERAARLLGCPERRAALQEFEIRAGSGNTFVVRGYASVVDHPYEVYGGPERGGWTETVKRGAFDTTLAAKPDVSFLINHDGMPLARTRSGTLQLRADNTGLESEAVVDRRDPFGQALEVKMQRGDLDQMSFGFRVTRQSWNENYTERDITEVNLDHGDVSVVNEPANPATSISIVRSIAVLREMELAEARAQLGNMSAEDVLEAQARLGQLAEQMGARAAKSAGTVTVDVVPVLRGLDLSKIKDADADELRAMLLSIGDDGSVTQCDPDAMGGEDDDDEDDQQVTMLIGLVQQLVGVVLNGRSASASEIEERTEEVAPEETEERAEEGDEPVVTVVRPSTRLLRARMLDDEYRRANGLSA